MNFSITDIKKVLPHRAPFLFIDKVKDIVPGKTGVGVKLVTADEIWCAGNGMVLPGSFFVEIMAQTCAMICAANLDNTDNLGQGYLAGFDLACPGRAGVGDSLEAHVAIIKIWGPLILATGTIMVDNKEIGKGRLTIGLVEPVAGQT